MMTAAAAPPPPTPPPLATRLVPPAQLALQATSRARMKLSNVVTGPIAKPPRILLYGVDGIGKTTFAANAPAPIILGTEDGTAKLPTPRFPEPRSWMEAIAALDELAAAEHDYRTVAIDTLDWLEPLCWEHVCAGKVQKNGRPVESIEDIGYGKGYLVALDEWRVLLSKLDHLRNSRGMLPILIAHSWIRPFRNPEGEDFDRFEIKLHAKAAGLIREWADVVLFATHEQYTHEINGRSKGISTGARIMYTERQAAFDAKNRHHLPPTLPLDWNSLQDAMDAGQPADPARIRERIALALSGTDDAALKDRVARAMLAVGDNASELARIQNKLTAQLNIQQQEASR